MIGAKLSKPALQALYNVKKSRCIKKFSQTAMVDIRTVQKMAKGGYVEIGLVRKVEAVLPRFQMNQTTAQVIIQHVAKQRNVDVQRLLTEKSNNKYGMYSEGELARYIAIHIIYKETRLSYRQIAAEVGYRDHTSVIRSLERISDLMDINPALRREVLSIQNSIAA